MVRYRADVAFHCCRKRPFNLDAVYFITVIPDLWLSGHAGICSFVEPEVGDRNPCT